MVEGLRSTQSFTKKKGSLTRINLESKWAINFIRKLISDNSDKSIFFEHEIHGWNGSSVCSVFSVFMFILTTDIQNLTDANHERKRDFA